MQAFKETDQKELRVRNAIAPTIGLVSNNRSEFYHGATASYGLGQVLLNLKNDPMAIVLDPATFLESYPAFHDLFTRPGTFEFYLQVFRSIWGNQVNIEFVIPNPGHLQINITALDSRTDNFSFREIIDNSYTYGNLLDHNGDSIMLQSTQGIKTQDEVNRMVIELHPIGVFVEANLTIS